ncbi:hypothetical protein [Lapillicoccus sp.]|uniref:hypothetical protein n=1 Tax=Lapillicoccus sp. TaxID=1909287 RepID=UPI003983662D
MNGEDGASDSIATRVLVAELAVVRDRLQRDASSGGYASLPGQAARRAVLLRRERRITNALRRRLEAVVAGPPMDTSAPDPDHVVQHVPV